MEQKHSKPWDMHFQWLKDRQSQDQFYVYWDKAHGVVQHCEIERKQDRSIQGNGQKSSTCKVEVTQEPLLHKYSYRIQETIEQ